MKWLGEVIKELPNNLEHLSLDLSNNRLGENYYNIQLFGEGLK